VEAIARKSRRRPGRWTLISGVCLISVGVLSFNAYAQFTATATDDQAISSGDMTLNLANETTATVDYDLAGTNLAPGDTMQRAATLVMGGNVSATSIDITADSADDTALVGAGGLTLKIDSCSNEWTEVESGGIPTYAVCSGGGSTAVVLAETELADLISSGAAGLTTGLNLSGTSHLKLTWKLPSTADNTFKNLTESSIEITFSANQRSGTNK
jgi:hypothetical protein